MTNKNCDACGHKARLTDGLCEECYALEILSHEVRDEVILSEVQRGFKTHRKATA